MICIGAVVTAGISRSRLSCVNGENAGAMWSCSAADGSCERKERKVIGTIISIVIVSAICAAMAYLYGWEE